MSRDEDGFRTLPFTSAPLGESVLFSLSLSLVLSLFHSQEQLSSFFQASENEGSNYSQIWEPTVQTPRQKWVSLSGFQNL